MPSTASSYERRLAYAIQAGLHDAQLERSGKQVVFFFDADVIAGSLFARSKIEGEIARQAPFTRSVVRALWLQGKLPCVRLTIPHLLELQRVLRGIKTSGTGPIRPDALKIPRAEDVGPVPSRCLKVPSFAGLRAANWPPIRRPGKPLLKLDGCAVTAT